MTEGIVRRSGFGVWGVGVEVDGVDLVDVVDGVEAIRRWGEWAIGRPAAAKALRRREGDGEDEYESEPGRGRPAAP